MKIINKTHWDTKSIQRLLAETLKRSNKIEGVFKRRKHLEVEIVYSKRSNWRNPEHNFTGNATYNGSHMKIRVPREKIDSRVFARVFDHELYHLRGWHHNKLGVIGGRFLNLKNLEKDNLSLEYPIILKNVTTKKLKIKIKVDLQLKRFEHVLKMLKDRKNKLKRLQKQIQKWTVKKKYYEKILVANGKIKKEEK